MADEQTAIDLTGLTADIVSAYVANNIIQAADIPALIGSVHSALAAAANGTKEEAPEQPLTPAVPIRKSITPDYIVCLEDGKRFKSLKRHLRSRYNLTPEDYRQRWNLPADYPMVAPNYAAARSNLAKSMGLGQMRRREAGAAEQSTSMSPEKKPGRRKKAA